MTASEQIVDQILQRLREHERRVQAGDAEYLQSEQALCYFPLYPLPELERRLRAGQKALTAPPEKS